MSWILHLETSTKVCSVALSQNGELHTLREIKDDQFSHGEQLTLLIAQVLGEAAIKPADLAAVSVASGPGSYTGLRIGVSTAKGFCYALQIPLIAIDALTALAENARAHFPGQRLCPMIDARRMEVYATIFDAEMQVLKPLGADVLDAYSYKEFEPFVCFGDGAAKMLPHWEHRAGIYWQTDLGCSASGQVRIAWDKFCSNDVEDVAYFEPLYLKEFYTTAKKAEE